MNPPERLTLCREQVPWASSFAAVRHAGRLGRVRFGVRGKEADASERAEPVGNPFDSQATSGLVGDNAHSAHRINDRSIGAGYLDAEEFNRIADIVESDSSASSSEL